VSENERAMWLKLLVLLLIVIIGFSVVVGLFGTGSGMMGGGMMGGGMMGFGWLFMLAPILFIIFLIYALSDRETPQTSQQPYYGQETSMDILERRYTSGEISRSEYFKIKEDINRR
jgi:putative membrane protein